ETIPKATIKWPNDLRVEGRKLAGILTELSVEGERTVFVVLGVGVNLNAQLTDFPPEIAKMATSLREVRGEPVARPSFVAGFLTRLEEWLDLHEEVGFAPVRAAWKEMNETLGRVVRVSSGTGGPPLIGTAEDIDDSGALWVRVEDGSRQRVLAGD